MERRQNKKRNAKAREEAEVVVEDVERLERKNQLLLEEIKKKERKLGYFKGVHDQLALISQHEKDDLQESIEKKEKKLQKARNMLQGKERQVKICKEKIQKLMKRIEQGVMELWRRDRRIIQLENEKAKLVADLESERVKVRFRLFWKPLEIQT